MRAKCEAGILVLTVFVLGAIAGGAGYRLWAGPVVNGPAAEAGALRGQPPSGKSPFASLDLTPDQQQQLGTIMDDQRKRLREVYGTYKAKADEIHTETRVKIRAILTPEQQAKFDAVPY